MFRIVRIADSTWIVGLITIDYECSKWDIWIYIIEFYKLFIKWRLDVWKMFNTIYVEIGME